MYSLKRKFAVHTALLSALVLGTPAFAADEATLAHNEAAAQHVIVDTSVSDHALAGTVGSTLAHNEAAAQRAIADTSTSDRSIVSGAIGEATLERNEIAAQRAIAAQPAARVSRNDRSISSIGAVTKPLAAR